MRRWLLGVLALGAVVLAGTAYVRTVEATPASGFTGTTLAVARFGDIDVAHHLLIVTAGTGTTYEGNDRRCKPHVYTAGVGLSTRVATTRT